MTNIIRKIKAGENIEQIFQFVLHSLYRHGPVSATDMEILSYLKWYCPDEFKQHENSVLNYMALFYKDTESRSLKDLVLKQYAEHIEETYSYSYTPVQASIIREIDNNRCFSFSAPTSTGKSFVFMNLINQYRNDVVIVVPSRALINEYYIKLCDLIADKTVNILTFIDKINTKHAKRSVFIVTPERCRDLFKHKDNFNIELFLFDEAQLSNEDSKRGLYFDSIVRRSDKAYPNATFVFAHPFVKNPESQIKKNHFATETSSARQYTQKNVGQMFLCMDSQGIFHHFGIDKAIMGNNKVICDRDPIEEAIKNGGSVLFYVSKASIYKNEHLEKFGKYINLCKEIEDEKAEYYISQLQDYTGAEIDKTKSHFSQMIALLKRGIVIHHGSLPLQTRTLIERFTKDNLCRICFATSTLEQGINMPFDVVFLDVLEGSKTLSVKNLIGRAGRSSTDSEFDFGFVVVRGMSKFRGIFTQDEVLDEISSFEKDGEADDDYREFKESILNNTFSDEFNLTEKELATLTSEETEQLVEKILNTLFIDNKELMPLDVLRADERCMIPFYDSFRQLYSAYLGRELGEGEADVLNTAMKIMLWRVHGKTFKNICWYRYSYATRSREKQELGAGYLSAAAAYFTGFADIPNKNHPRYTIFAGVKAKDVDYDRIIYDTYDFIDKLIGFKLSDVFYATFIKYYEKTQDIRSYKLAQYIKFGTDNERHIWMLRYGLSFEDIEVLDEHIKDINSHEISFYESIKNIPESLTSSIVRFM